MDISDFKEKFIELFGVNNVNLQGETPPNGYSRYYQAFPFDSNKNIHYELIQHAENGPVFMEFHIERSHYWEYGDLLQKFKEAFSTQENLRDFSSSSYYSNLYWAMRRPVFTEAQLAEDIKRIRTVVDSVTQQYNINEISNTNTESLSTSIQNLMPLKKLLKLNLCIPEYQRPYCWRKENVIGLIEDLKNKNDGEPIHLGVVILKKKKEQNQENVYFDIIDGQQRLLTLAIFANVVLKQNDFPLLMNPLPAQNATGEAQQYLLRAQEAMSGYNPGDFSDILENTVFSVVILDENESDDLAFTFFSHTNSAGMPLSDYDLLKTHHLRYLKDERLAEKAVHEWNMLPASDRVQLVHNTLFRLRKWSAGEKNFPIQADDPRVRELFKHFRVEMDPLEGCSSWPRPSHFNSILNGGEEFFSYISEYQKYYADFKKQLSIVKLQASFAWHSYGTLLNGMLPLCFLFYCKFGERYLPEASYCIAYRISELRNKGRVMRSSLSTENIFRECTVIIDRATLEGEVFARLLDPRKNYEIANRGLTAENYWNALYTYMKNTEQEQNNLLLPKQFHQSGRFAKMLEEKKNEQ